ncbi:MAG: DUF2834 domain-containing protein [Cyanobacteria bacterium P01_C01_bin.89]
MSKTERFSLPVSQSLLIFGTLWLGFIAYAAILAPPDDPETLDVILRLSSGQTAELNPLLVAVFNLMGIWPMIYGCVLLADGHGRSPKAWPFLAGSFGVGAFAVLPYLGLRKSLEGEATQDFSEGRLWTLKFWDSRWLALALFAGAGALVFYGITQGDWADFVTQWQSSKFVHVMSLDFCALSVLFPTLVADDVTRRGGKNSSLWTAITCIPLFGPLTYLLLRPSLFQKTVESAEK